MVGLARGVDMAVGSQVRSKDASCPPAQAFAPIFAFSLSLPSPALLRLRRAIQRVRRADQPEMREGLREIPQVIPIHAQLLREEADVVGVPQHLFEDIASLLQIPRAA